MILAQGSSGSSRRSLVWFIAAEARALGSGGHRSPRSTAPVSTPMLLVTPDGSRRSRWARLTRLRWRTCSVGGGGALVLLAPDGQVQCGGRRGVPPEDRRPADQTAMPTGKQFSSKQPAAS